MNKLRMAAMTFAAFPPLAAMSQNSAPTLGLIYNSKENSSITYDCKPVSSDGMECKFIQVSVRKKASPGDLGKALAKAKEEFKKGAKLTSEQCTQYKAFVDVLEGRAKAPNPEGIANIAGTEKQDLLRSMRAITEFCKSPTEDNYLRIVRENHAKETRSCTVASNTFTQTFTRLSGTVGKNTKWVTKSTPEGPCGTVQLCRFEQDQSVGFPLWRYYAKKAITNPSGELLPGMRCSSLDEGEYLYDWKGDERFVGCDYVTFTVF